MTDMPMIEEFIKDLKEAIPEMLNNDIPDEESTKIIKVIIEDKNIYEAFIAWKNNPEPEKAIDEYNDILSTKIEETYNNLTGTTFDAVIKWLLEQEEKMSYASVSNAARHKFNFKVVRLHLQDPKKQWEQNRYSSDYILCMLIYSILKVDTALGNVIRVLCKSCDNNSYKLEDRLLAVILRLATPCFDDIENKILDLLPNDHTEILALRLINAIRKSE